MTSKQLKSAAAGVGASAAIAMAALGALAGSPDGPQAVSQDPEITLGETTTSETGKTELETSVAVPEVTAEPAPEAG